MEAGTALEVDADGGDSRHAALKHEAILREIEVNLEYRRSLGRSPKRAAAARQECLSPGALPGKGNHPSPACSLDSWAALYSHIGNMTVGYRMGTI